MADLAVPVERLAHARDLPLPAYATTGAAGLDLVAALPEAAPLELAPGAWCIVPTGIRLALPEGYEGQVRPRSGLALRHGVTVLNAPGTIDADYRGEVGVILINLGHVSFRIERGSRVAQLVVAPIARVGWREVAVGDAATVRGAAGFGSTGAAVSRAGAEGNRD
jgi:dUTP pyrophosphatase